jgi:hypothetical protein
MPGALSEVGVVGLAGAGAGASGKRAGSVSPALAGEEAGGAPRRRVRPVATARLGVSFDVVVALDMELVRVARSAGALRLAVGEGLLALGRRSGFRELGFSSEAAYVLERCERSKRWGQEARGMAERLARLPSMRQALVSGRLSWSAAQVVTRVATASDEAAWLERASGCTVRQLRALIGDDATDGADGADVGDEGPALDPTVTLTITADREDIWLYKAAEETVRAVTGTAAVGAVVDALIGEAWSSMMEYVPDGTELLIPEPDEEKARAWAAQRAEWQRQGEMLCEDRILRAPMPPMGEVRVFDFEEPATKIDREIGRIARLLFERDIRIGELATRLWKANGWRRLGYGSERQYARERLAMSLSSMKVKRRLAARLERLRVLETATRRGELGFEAARLVSEIATAGTEVAWVARARERTVVHLREEVGIAEHVSRIALIESVEPPDDALVAEMKEFRTRLTTGASLVPMSEHEKAQLSAREAGARDAVLREHERFFARQAAIRKLRTRARDTIRLRVPLSMRARYRGLERAYARFRPREWSFLAFAASALLASHALPPAPVAYGQIYARDGYRCMNPCCTRRDATPHHVVFLGRGGRDDDANVVTLCVECHLRLVHGGTMAVTGTAPGALTWVLGREEHTVVRGRQRVRRP